MDFQEAQREWLVWHRHSVLNRLCSERSCLLTARRSAEHMHCGGHAVVPHRTQCVLLTVWVVEPGIGSQSSLCIGTSRGAQEVCWRHAVVCH